MLEPSYVIVGSLTGLILGVTGVGGGALMTPLLLLVFGVPPVQAIATDLWFAAMTKLVGASIHHGAGQVDWQVAKRLWVGSLPMALAIVFLVNWFGSVGQFSWLGASVGIVVILTGLGLFLAPWLLSQAKKRRIEQPLKFKAFQPILTVVAGGTLGVCVALTSVGAGALGSVMLIYLYPLRMTPHRLVATDLVHAIPLAVIAGLGYLVAGHVNWWMLASLLCGSVPAVVLGSLLAQRMRGKKLQFILAIVLVSSGIKILAL